MARGIKTGGRDFIKGISGNPGGRPKKEDTCQGVLEDLVSRDPPKELPRLANIQDEFEAFFPDVKNPTYKHYCMFRLLLLVISGDVTAIHYFMNRLDGYPRQALEHSGSIMTTFYDMMRIGQMEAERRESELTSGIQEDETATDEGK